MGLLTFLLPENLSGDAARELERACVAGGPDNMPWPSRAHVEHGVLTVRRDVGESGFLVAPWAIPGVGRLMGATATIMERESAYHFQVEMARGKVNQLRCQAEEWRAGGLALTPSLEESIRNASLGFGQAILGPINEETDALAEKSLTLSYRAALELAQAYVNQVFTFATSAINTSKLRLAAGSGQCRRRRPSIRLERHSTALHSLLTGALLNRAKVSTAGSSPTRLSIGPISMIFRLRPVRSLTSPQLGCPSGSGRGNATPLTLPEWPTNTWQKLSSDIAIAFAAGMWPVPAIALPFFLLLKKSCYG